MLVQRNLSKILPAALRDMADWTTDTRIKVTVGLKLLTKLILNGAEVKGLICNSCLWLSMLDFSLMLRVKLPVVRRIQS